MPPVICWAGASARLGAEFAADVADDFADDLGAVLRGGLLLVMEISGVLDVAGMTRRTDWQRPWNEFATSMGAAPLSSRYMQRYTGTFETLHHWFYAFWHRRKLEGNDALVLDALGWIRRVYGAT